jgi:hypothetical protein
MSPPGQGPNTKFQSTLRNPPDLGNNVLLAVLFDSNGNSYTVHSLRSHICLYVHIFSQYRGSARAKEIITMRSAYHKFASLAIDKRGSNGGRIHYYKWSQSPWHKMSRYSSTCCHHINNLRCDTSKSYCHMTVFVFSPALNSVCPVPCLAWLKTPCARQLITKFNKLLVAQILHSAIKYKNARENMPCLKRTGYYSCHWDV